MTDGQSATVTAAELVRHFARFRDNAMREPVFITHHGRPTHVLLNIHAYEGLSARPKRDLAGSNGLVDSCESLYSFSDWIDEGLIICDLDLNILFLNRVAAALTHRSVVGMAGRALTDAIPEIGGSLIEVHARRTITGIEPSSADIPSPFHDGSWLHVQSFPIADCIVLKFRDITDDVRQHRLADVKKAILEGMCEHGGVGYVRLSLRGTIDRADAPFCDMLDLNESRLIGVHLADLVSRTSRAAFREALERVLRLEGPARLETQFLTNSGNLVGTLVSIVPLTGALGAEGAVVVLTRTADDD